MLYSKRAERNLHRTVLYRCVTDVVILVVVMIQVNTTMLRYSTVCNEIYLEV